jgi:hypothetical protein
LQHTANLSCLLEDWLGFRQSHDPNLGTCRSRNRFVAIVVSIETVALVKGKITIVCSAPVGTAGCRLPAAVGRLPGME